MRKLLAVFAIAPMILGCFHSQWSITFDPFNHKEVPVVNFDDVKQGTKCYQTVGYLDVYVGPGVECPPAQMLNEAEAKAYERLQPIADLLPSLAGASVTFVDAYIKCDSLTVGGCTEGYKMVVSTHSVLGPEAHPILTPEDGFIHETGHELRFLTKRPMDPGHLDCKWWHVLDGFDWPGCTPKGIK